MNPPDAAADAVVLRWKPTPDDRFAPRASIAALLDGVDRPGWFAIDLRELRYVDWTLLETILERIAASPAHVSLLADDSVRRLLELHHLDRFVPCFADEPAFRDSVRRRQSGR